jgi:hypothetical protein
MNTHCIICNVHFTKKKGSYQKLCKECWDKNRRKGLDKRNNSIWKKGYDPFCISVILRK